MTPDILDTIDATLDGWEHASADAARWTPDGDSAAEEFEWVRRHWNDDLLTALRDDTWELIS